MVMTRQKEWVLKVERKVCSQQAGSVQNFSIRSSDILVKQVSYIPQRKAIESVGEGAAEPLGNHRINCRRETAFAIWTHPLF